MTTYSKGKPMTAVNGGQLRVEQGNNRIVVDQGSVEQLLFGVDDNGVTVIKVAQPGIDVRNATDAQLIFNSNQDIFKIAAAPIGTVNITFSTLTSAIAGGFQVYSTNLLTLPHNLGIVPALAPQLFNATTGFYTPVSSGSSIGQPVTQFNGFGVFAVATYTWDIWADTKNVYIKGVMAGGAGNTTTGYTIAGFNWGNFTFKVFCLQETAN